MNNNVVKNMCSLPMDTTHQFSLQANITVSSTYVVLTLSICELFCVVVSNKRPPLRHQAISHSKADLGRLAADTESKSTNQTWCSYVCI